MGMNDRRYPISLGGTIFRTIQYFGNRNLKIIAEIVATGLSLGVESTNRTRGKLVWYENEIESGNSHIILIRIFDNNDNCIMSDN